MYCSMIATYAYVEALLNIFAYSLRSIAPPVCSEWQIFKPTQQKKDAKTTIITLHIRRVYSFYVQNVVGIMGALTYDLITHACD